ncbi:MAG: hypothetical protein ACFFE1_15260 [Candidatus Thorarchaeota archaeon]
MMKRLRKITPLLLILVVYMFLPGCIGQEEERIPYYGDDVRIQAGNSQQKYRLVHSSSVPDIRLGAGIYSSFTWSDLPNLDHTLNSIIDYGAWRVDTCVDEVEEPIFWDYNNEQEFPDEYDEFIDGLNENGVAVDYLLLFWDKTGHAHGEELTTPRFQTEEQIQEFLNHTRFVVSHYNDRVQYYTIWSEPSNFGGIKGIEVEDYINLVNRTVSVIHEEDPEAKVSIAAIITFWTRDYINAIIDSGIIPMVDVIQWHGIYDVLPNDPFWDGYYYEYPEIVERIRQRAAANGFDGEYWATEISYCSEDPPNCHPPDQPWEFAKTDKEAAKYASRAVVMHLGRDIGIAMQTWLPDIPQSAPWTHQATSNLYKVLAGTSPVSLVVEFSSEPTNTLNYTFKMPDGDTLIAYWTHGVAVDDDPGVSTNLTFPGVSAQKVVAIDVLNGFEQELIIGMENGDLVIRNIFVMDYPIILRISNDTSTITSQNQFPLMQLSIVIGVPVVVIGVLVLWKKRTVRKGVS